MSDAGSVSRQGNVGGAFSVAEGLLALRWADIVRARGYRLSFSHSFVEADEALEIRRVPQRKAIATIFLGVHWVWVIDVSGAITSHETLEAALCSLVTLTPAERRGLALAGPPAWLWHPRPVEPGLMQRWGLTLARLPAVWRRVASARATGSHPVPMRRPE